LKYCGKLQPPE